METTYSGLLGGYVYGTGYQDVKSPTDPAAGSGISITAPGDRAYRIVSAYTSFTTSSATATRHPLVQFTDGAGNYLGRFRANSNQTASATSYYTIAAVSPPGGVTTAIVVPDLILYPGYTVTITAENIDVADTFTDTHLLIEEFPIGRDGYSTSGVTERKW